MNSQFAVISRSPLSEVLRAIKHYSRKEAASRLRDAVANHSVAWENDNPGNRQAIEINMADGQVSGFTVKFDGTPVFQYIGPDTATTLPTLSMTPLRKRLCGQGWREEFMLSLGGGFWSIIYHGCNGGVPFVMQSCPA